VVAHRLLHDVTPARLEYCACAMPAHSGRVVGWICRVPSGQRLIGDCCRLQGKTCNIASCTAKAKAIYRGTANKARTKRQTVTGCDQWSELRVFGSETTLSPIAYRLSPIAQTSAQTFTQPVVLNIIPQSSAYIHDCGSITLTSRVTCAARLLVSLSCPKLLHRAMS
jgi:hypothetical protein